MFTNRFGVRGLGRALAGASVFAWLAVGATAAFASPKIQHWTLDNGARVYFVESRGVPMLQLNVVFDAGSAREPADKNGLAAMTAQLLDEGTGALGPDEVATAFEGLGAEYSASSQRDMAGATLRTLSDPELRAPALELFAQLLARPAFPEASLARERQRVLVGLKRSAQSPGDIASKAFYRALYRDHPYALDPDGSEAGLKAITREDLAAFHRRYYVGGNAVLAMIGDVSVRDAKKIAHQVLGALPAGAAAPAIPAVADVARGERSQRVIAHPSSQSHIVMGEAGMTRDDPDYFPLYVGNFILGGSGLVSRLSDEVREKRGLSYSVYSYFMPMRAHGPLVIGLQTKNGQRAEALAVMRKTVADFVANGPTDAELERAKKNLTGGFPLRIDSNKKIAEYLTVIGFYRLPLTYIDDFIPRVEAVSSAQIRDAFQRRVHPEHMVTVIVGGRGG